MKMDMKTQGAQKAAERGGRRELRVRGGELSRWRVTAFPAARPRPRPTFRAPAHNAPPPPSPPQRPSFPRRPPTARPRSPARPPIVPPAGEPADRRPGDHGQRRALRRGRPAAGLQGRREKAEGGLLGRKRARCAPTWVGGPRRGRRPPRCACVDVATAADPRGGWGGRAEGTADAALVPDDRPRVTGKAPKEVDTGALDEEEAEARAEMEAEEAANPVREE